jgi:hypothetical protein
MTDLGFLRRSKAGHAGSSAHVQLALLSFVYATTSLLLSGAAMTFPSRGLFGHGHLNHSAVPR